MFRGALLSLNADVIKIAQGSRFQFPVDICLVVSGVEFNKWSGGGISMAFVDEVHRQGFLIVPYQSIPKSRSGKGFQTFLATLKQVLLLLIDGGIGPYETEGVDANGFIFSKAKSEFYLASLTFKANLGFANFYLQKALRLVKVLQFTHVHSVGFLRKPNRLLAQEFLAQPAVGRKGNGLGQFLFGKIIVALKPEPAYLFVGCPAVEHRITGLSPGKTGDS